MKGISQPSKTFESHLNACETLGLCRHTRSCPILPKVVCDFVNQDLQSRIGFSKARCLPKVGPCPILPKVVCNFVSQDLQSPMRFHKPGLTKLYQILYSMLPKVGSCPILPKVVFNFVSQDLQSHMRFRKPGLTKSYHISYSTLPKVGSWPKSYAIL